MFGRAVAAPPAGRLVARFGPRPVVAASGAFLSVGLVALAAAPASPAYFALVAFGVGVLSIGTPPPPCSSPCRGSSTASSVWLSAS